MNYNTTIKLVLLFAGLILILNLNLFSLNANSGISAAYIEPSAKQITMDDTIEGKIIKATGHFFAGRANIQRLLLIIEMQDINGINSTTLDQVVGAAILNIKNSRDIYLQIVKQADSTPYNPITLSQLKDYPYEELQTSERLNRTIFARVKFFLTNGNVTGVFRSTLQQLNTMLSLLKKIKKDFRVGKVPEIALFWKLNETAAETALSGSYVTRVFRQFK